VTPQIQLLQTSINKNFHHGVPVKLQDLIVVLNGLRGLKSPFSTSAMAQKKIRVAPGFEPLPYTVIVGSNLLYREISSIQWKFQQILFKQLEQHQTHIENNLDALVEKNVPDPIDY